MKIIISFVKTLFITIILLVIGLYFVFFIMEYKRVSSTYCGNGTVMGIVRQNMNTYWFNFIYKKNFPIQNGCDSNIQSVQQVSKPIVKKVGESFVLWNINYQVVSASVFKPTYDFQETTGKYIGVKIKVTNEGNTESMPNKVIIKDNKGRQYESAMLGYQQLNVADYGQEKVQAGIPKTYGVIFEVAKDSTGLKLEYPSSQGPIVASVSLGL